MAQLAAALAHDQPPRRSERSTTRRRRTRTRNISSTKRCSAPGRSDAGGQPQRTDATPEYIARIQAYMAKALKEAKVNTSWIQPNEQWDTAMHDFVARILDAWARRTNSSRLFSRGRRDRPARRNQFALAQAGLETDRAGRAGYLSGERDLGFQPGRSGQSAAGRLQAPARNAGRLERHSARGIAAKPGPTDGSSSLSPNGCCDFGASTRSFSGRAKYVPFLRSGTHADCVSLSLASMTANGLIGRRAATSSRVGFPPIGERWARSRLWSCPKSFPTAA